MYVADISPGITMIHIDGNAVRTGTDIHSHRIFRTPDKTSATIDMMEMIFAVFGGNNANEFDITASRAISNPDTTVPALMSALKHSVHKRNTHEARTADIHRTFSNCTDALCMQLTIFHADKQDNKTMTDNVVINSIL